MDASPELVWLPPLAHLAVLAPTRNNLLDWMKDARCAAGASHLHLAELKDLAQRHGVLGWPNLVNMLDEVIKDLTNPSVLPAGSYFWFQASWRSGAKDMSPLVQVPLPGTECASDRLHAYSDACKPTPGCAPTSMCNSRQPVLIPYQSPPAWNILFAHVCSASCTSCAAWRRPRAPTLGRRGRRRCSTWRRPARSCAACSAACDSVSGPLQHAILFPNHRSMQSRL